MKLKTMTRKDARTIGEALDVALKSVADDLGLTLKNKGGSYDKEAGIYKPRIEFSLQEMADGRTSEQVLFEQDCCFYYLKPEQFGAEITYGGNAYTVVGFNTRSTKYPIKVRRVSDGKAFKLPRRAIDPIAADLKDEVDSIVGAGRHEPASNARSRHLLDGLGR